MSAPKADLIPLTRAWLRVKGADALRFLGGMWTVDFKRSLEGAGPGCGCGFFLNAKGKAICQAVFVSETPTSFLFSIAPNDLESTRSALDHYLVADYVELLIPERPPFAQVFAAPESPFQPPLLRIPGPTTQAVDDVFKVHEEYWGWRIPRGIFSARHEEFWLKPGQNLPLEARLMSSQEYDQLRVEKGTPEWGVDLLADSLPLEFPVAPYISFFKGCYIGQEVIARATYRGRMAKFFSRFSGAQNLICDYVYSESDEQRPVGRISTVSANRGLGLVRLSAVEAKEELFQKAPDGSKISIKGTEPLMDLAVRPAITNG